MTKSTVKISFLIGIPLLAETILQTIGLKYIMVPNSAFITGCNTYSNIIVYSIQKED